MSVIQSRCLGSRYTLEAKALDPPYGRSTASLTYSGKTLFADMRRWYRFFVLKVDMMVGYRDDVPTQAPINLTGDPMIHRGLVLSSPQWSVSSPAVQRSLSPLRAENGGQTANAPRRRGDNGDDGGKRPRADRGPGRNP